MLVSSELAGELNRSERSEYLFPPDGAAGAAVGAGLGGGKPLNAGVWEVEPTGGIGADTDNMCIVNIFTERLK